MNKEYKTFEELKEELGDKFEEFMYKANIELLDKVNQLEKKNEALLKQKKEAINYIKKLKKLGLRYHSKETLFKMQTIYRMLVGREEGGSDE